MSGDIIQEEVIRRGLKVDRENLVAVGNSLREKEGKEVLAKRAMDKIRKIHSDLFVIESIRNPGEVEYLQKIPGFFLIGVSASPKVRFSRMKIRATRDDPTTWKEFCLMEERDNGKGEKSTGQQIKACMEMTDFRVLNNGPQENTYKLIDSILQKITS